MPQAGAKSVISPKTSERATDVDLRMCASIGHPAVRSVRHSYRIGTQIECAEVDGDGRRDVVLVAGTTEDRNGVVAVALNATTTGAPVAAFEPADEYVVDREPFRIAVGDLNGDSLPDLAIACAPFTEVSNHVPLLFQDPSRPGHFLPQVHVAPDPAHLGSSSVSIADLDGDGLVVTTGHSPNVTGFSVLLQDPAVPGSFLPAVRYPLHP